MFYFFLISGLILLAGTVHGAWTGELRVKLRDVRRDESPVLFWYCFAMLLVIAAFCLWMAWNEPR